VITDSMRTAIDETDRRRSIQVAYNESHGISPVGIVKAIRDITDQVRKVAEEKGTYTSDGGGLPKEELTRMVIELEKQMKQAAKSLEFEKAAMLRDQVIELRKALVSDTESLKELAAVAGHDGMQPYTDTNGRRSREVSYKPGRRGARYRR
jgi:excinuclease ABC subunit B